MSTKKKAVRENPVSYKETPDEPFDRITRISVEGFKSIHKEQSIELRPLTILAGANSSGKSSIMQPLLLLKQTLEATYDPGTLLLNGPHVKFTSTDQILSSLQKNKTAKTFSIGVEVNSRTLTTVYSVKEQSKGFSIQKMVHRREGEEKTFIPHTTDQDLSIFMHISGIDSTIYEVLQNRCFLELKIDGRFTLSPAMLMRTQYCIQKIIHLPGLRGNPERAYRATAVGKIFPGTFDTYVASVIAHWEMEKQIKELTLLSKALEKIGLTSKVTANFVNDTQVEIKVGRLPHASQGGSQDLVSIADVGFGVSQTLPVLVGLIAAEPGQMVYIEQPEIHLHPRAQVGMAEVLAEAAKRGVTVVAETHSDLLLRGIQTLVARGELLPELVVLHWFNRSPKTGETTITTAYLDKNGAFGDWPEDFDDIALSTERAYLDAVARNHTHL